MNRVQCCSWLLGVTLLSLLASKPVSTIAPMPRTCCAPAFIMVYGDGLQHPIVVQVPDLSTYTFFWNTVRGGANYETQRGGTVPQGLGDRPYWKIAIFWGRYDPATMKPEDASQHARLYLPSASEPAVIVTTAPVMAPIPLAVPTDLRTFIAGWVLNAQDLATVKALGIPGV